MKIRYAWKALLIANVASLAMAGGATTEEMAAGGMLMPLATTSPLLLEKESESPLAFCYHTGWASKYVSEGVDSFGKGGIWEFSPEISYKEFTFTTWYGLSDSINASELKLIGNYYIHLSDSLTLVPSYEHAYASPGNGYSDTPALGVAYHVNDWLTVGADIQWDVADGRWRGYYDGYAEASFELTDRIQVCFMALYAFNDGYLGEDIGHGSNTIDYSLTLTANITDNLSCSCCVNYSQALTVLRQGKSYDEESGFSTRYGNEFWVGTYLQYEF